MRRRRRRRPRSMRACTPSASSCAPSRSCTKRCALRGAHRLPNHHSLAEPNHLALPQGLLNEAVYIVQQVRPPTGDLHHTLVSRGCSLTDLLWVQEILVAQLLGQPTPTLRLADGPAAPPPPRSSSTAGPADWAEPVPRSVLPSRAAVATAAESDSDTEGDGHLAAPAELLPTPRGRRNPRRRRSPAEDKKKPDKDSRRPRPGGPSRRAAGPPYREDPIGPLSSQPDPQREPEPEPEKNGPRVLPQVFAMGTCAVCGDVQRACTCSAEQLSPHATPTAKTETQTKTKKKKKKKKRKKKKEDAFATASSEYDYLAPSGAYLALSAGCEVIVTGRHDEDWLIGFRYLNDAASDGASPIRYLNDAASDGASPIRVDKTGAERPRSVFNGIILISYPRILISD